MTRPQWWLVPVLAVFAAATTQAADVPKVGDAVWVQWRPNAWYRGKVAKKGEIGLKIDFDDGDKGEVAPSMTALDRAPKKNEVKVGTRVLALGPNANYFPGVVTDIDRTGKYDVLFDVAATAKLNLVDLRVIAENPVAARIPKVGDTVWAQWRPNFWYRGKVAKGGTFGLKIDYDDGDSGESPIGHVALDNPPRKGDVKPGSRVLALWSDGKYYPALVTGVDKDRTILVQFDDGATGKNEMGDLRLLNE